MNTYPPDDTHTDALPLVWVVDDDDDDQTFLEMAFGVTTPAVRVLPLMDGAALLALLQQSDVTPRLIILDLNMPGLSGFDTLRLLRSQSAFAKIPVVMMTTSSDANDRARSLALGANLFVTKPNSYSQLTQLTAGFSQQWALS